MSFGASAIAFVVAGGFVVVKLVSLAFGPNSLFIRILWYLALGNACFFLLAALLTVGPGLLEVFFPKTGVGNASLFPGFTWRKLALPGFLGVLSIVVLAVLANFGWSFLYVAMILDLLILSFPVSNAFDRQKLPTGTPPAIEAVRALLLACEYAIFDRLQTGDLALDRLISVFDLVAHKNGTALAIQLKTGAPNVPELVTWTEASSLRTAVWAIYQGAEKQKVEVRNIQAVLVLCGRTADPSLTDFAKAESIGLVVLPDSAPLEGIAAGKFTSEQLRELARIYLPIGFETMGFGQAPGPPAEYTAC